MHNKGVRMKVLMTAEDMARSLERLAYQILEKHDKIEDIILVGIQRRGVDITCRLASILEKRCGKAIVTGTLDINLYRDDWTSLVSLPKIGSTSLPPVIEGKTIILIDDVLYTGRTIRSALEALNDYGRPQSIELLVLVDRGHRELPIAANYIGKQLNTARSEQVNVFIKERDGSDEVRLLHS